MINTYIVRHTCDSTSPRHSQTHEKTLVVTCESLRLPGSDPKCTEGGSRSIADAALQYVSYCQENEDGSFSIANSSGDGNTTETFDAARMVYAFTINAEPLLQTFSKLGTDGNEAVDLPEDAVPQDVLSGLLHSEVWLLQHRFFESEITIFAGATCISLRQFKKSVERLANAASIQKSEELRETPFWQYVLRESPSYAYASLARGRTDEHADRQHGGSNTFPRKTRGALWRERAISEATPRTCPIDAPQELDRHKGRPTWPAEWRS